MKTAVAIKHDGDKPRLDLLPPEALIEIAHVLTHGADKYGAYNWRKGMNWSRLFAAALRHMFAWQMGETHDSETQRSHLAHACCCLMFLMVYEKLSMGVDDRVK